MVDQYEREEIRKIAEQYVRLIRADLRVRKAYLYGSAVSGVFTKDSDIDIAIVADDFSGDFVEYLCRLMKLRRHIDNRIEPHPFKSDEFQPDNPFVAEIISTGIEIM